MRTFPHCAHFSNHLQYSLRGQDCRQPAEHATTLAKDPKAVSKPAAATAAVAPGAPRRLGNRTVFPEAPRRSGHPLLLISQDSLPGAPLRSAPGNDHPLVAYFSRFAPWGGAQTRGSPAPSPGCCCIFLKIRADTEMNGKWSQARGHWRAQARGHFRTSEGIPFTLRLLQALCKRQRQPSPRGRKQMGRTQMPRRRGRWTQTQSPATFPCPSSCGCRKAPIE